MVHSAEKMGFWSVFALVIGSQIGSAVLMLPANLAPYGLYAVTGWLFAGLGAVALALVFAQLCAWLPQTGGPHVYVKHAFGRFPAFLTGWTYWVISWVSSTVVVIASVGYLLPLFGTTSASFALFLEIALLAAMVLLNLRGVEVAGRAELFLTVLKFIPLIFIPACALFYFNSDNFMIASSLADLPVMSMVSRVTFLALWGFIGLETATAAAGSVENPTKTIPRAVVAGTLTVGLLYVFNSLVIMGALPGDQLMLSNAPYTDVSQLIFSGSWYLVLSLVSSIVVIGSLLAWVLTSGQIALGLAQDGFMPAVFRIKNKHGAPVVGLVVSSIGIVPLLVMTMSDTMASQILKIIDVSVIAFLYVYVACCLAFFNMLLKQQNRTIAPMVYGVVALLFCVWIMYQTPLITLLHASGFTLSGLPLYWWLQQPRLSQ